jgi:hypothetical protein
MWVPGLVSWDGRGDASRKEDFPSGELVVTWQTTGAKGGEDAIVKNVVKSS